MQLSRPVLEVYLLDFDLVAYCKLVSQSCVVMLFLLSVQAVIHLESIQPLPKRVDYLDSLVEKFITPNPENPNLASTIDREEISCILLEVIFLYQHN